MKKFSRRNVALYGEGWSRSARWLEVLLEEARQCPPSDYLELIEERLQEHARGES